MSEKYYPLYAMVDEQTVIRAVRLDGTRIDAISVVPDTGEVILQIIPETPEAYAFWSQARCSPAEYHIVLNKAIGVLMSFRK